MAGAYSIRELATGYERTTSEVLTHEGPQQLVQLGSVMAVLFLLGWIL